MFCSSITRSTFQSAVIAFALSLAPSAQAADGESWPQLEQRIDAKIHAFRQRENIHGMTVAITRNGRLIHSKGYGYSARSIQSNIAEPMKRFHRTRIGSVSKAVVTGPVAYKLLQKAGLDASTTKLYGSNGVLGIKYRPDIKIGFGRYNPIVAIAMGPNDKTYAWYTDGTVSVGSPNNLSRHKPPRSFTTADNTRIEDIRAIAIAGSTSKVYVWHNNGALSIGASRDLDAYKKIKLDADGDPKQKVKLPVGKAMKNVVGVGIAKSNDHIFAFYDDGTVSSGTSLDFTAYFVNRPYEPARHRRWRYKTRAIALASDDHVFAWYNDGKASSGMSHDLDKYRTVFNYQTPTTTLERRYRDITVQHLFDHRSGFQRSGDVDGAAAMFAQQLNGQAPSYRQIHQHFLRTRALKWAPGEGYAYSNHGMGLFTLIIEKLSGKIYRNYAVNNYLKQMGLKGDVRPQHAVLDQRDSRSYEYRWDEADQRLIYETLEFENSTTGLAAGGWTASAESLLAITNALDDKYAYDEIDSFGWKPGISNSLTHNGVTSGGTAVATIYPDPYQSPGDTGIRAIHVAIAVNTTLSSGPKRFRGTTGRMEKLANALAVEARMSAIPADFNIWAIRSNPSANE